MLFAAAAAIWHSMSGSTRERAASVALALAFFGLLVFNKQFKLIDVVYAKGQKLKNEAFVKWNSFSRIALAPEKNSGIPMIFIDADASTGIASFDFAHLTPRELQNCCTRARGCPMRSVPARRH